MGLHLLSGRLAFGLAAGLLVAGIGVSFAAGPDEIVAERRAGYKKMGENFKIMKDAVDAGADVKPLAANAQVVIDWGKQIPTMFPIGTETAGGTHALPAVWTDKADFIKRSEDLVAAATLLEQRAEAGDKDAFAAQFKATGAVCGGCHRSYRAKL
jgi:cytochrome c556